jgi:hypothetical protein
MKNPLWTKNASSEIGNPPSEARYTYYSIASNEELM